MLNINTKDLTRDIGLTIEQCIEHEFDMNVYAKKIIVTAQVTPDCFKRDFLITSEEEDKNVIYRTINGNPDYILTVIIMSLNVENFMIFDSCCIESYSIEEFHEKERELKWNNFALVSKVFLDNYIYPYIKSVHNQFPDKWIDKIIVQGNKKQLKTITTTDDDFTCIMPNNIELEFVSINEDACSPNRLVLTPIFNEYDEEDNDDD